MKNNEIKITINAEPGSKLERAVFQLLKDVKEIGKQLMETFQENKKKQQKKIERRL